MSPSPSQPPLRRRLELALSGSSVKHALRPFYYAANRWRFGALQARNAELRNRHSGRCFILLTGPSLDGLPFQMLAAEAVVGAALSCKHPGFRHLRNVVSYADIEPIQNLRTANIDFDVWCDGSGIDVTPDTAAMYADDLYRDVPQILAARNAPAPTPRQFYALIDEACRDSRTTFFFNASNRDFFEGSGLFKGRRTHWITTTKPAFTSADEICVDLAGDLNCTSGSAFFSLALALYLGFREIYLAGFGYTYSPRQEFHFYDLPRMSIASGRHEAEAAFKMIAISRGVDLARLEERNGYFYPQFVRSITVDPRHAKMRGFAESLGARIYNIVPAGFSSPVYEQRSWADVKGLLNRSAIGTADRENAS